LCRSCSSGLPRRSRVRGSQLGSAGSTSPVPPGKQGRTIDALNQCPLLEDGSDGGQGAVEIVDVHQRHVAQHWPPGSAARAANSFERWVDLAAAAVGPQATTHTPGADRAGRDRAARLRADRRANRLVVGYVRQTLRRRGVDVRPGPRSRSEGRWYPPRAQFPDGRGPPERRIPRRYWI
jgi:hypothetical protein